jgi:hypothetical protein
VFEKISAAGRHDDLPYADFLFQVPAGSRAEELFVAARAGHEVADGIAGVFVVVEDGIDLLGDGHLDSVAGGEADGGGSGADAFGDLAVESCEDVGELAATAELDADGAVAGERAGAGEDEIADAGVWRWPPQAMARRVISTMPRVMRAAAEL